MEKTTAYHHMISVDEGKEAFADALHRLTVMKNREDASGVIYEINLPSAGSLIIEVISFEDMTSTMEGLGRLITSTSFTMCFLTKEDVTEDVRHQSERHIASKADPEAEGPHVKYVLHKDLFPEDL